MPPNPSPHLQNGVGMETAMNMASGKGDPAARMGELYLLVLHACVCMYEYVHVRRQYASPLDAFRNFLVHFGMQMQAGR